MLAAWSLQVHGHFVSGEDQRGRHLGQAIDLATEASSADSDNAKAQVQFATAIGRHAEAIVSFEASNQAGNRTRTDGQES